MEFFALVLHLLIWYLISLYSCWCIEDQIFNMELFDIMQVVFIFVLLGWALPLDVGSVENMKLRLHMHFYN